jgi:CubicO group peptidase (beta-lactamase class C family)
MWKSVGRRRGRYARGMRAFIVSLAVAVACRGLEAATTPPATQAPSDESAAPRPAADPFALSAEVEDISERIAPLLAKSKVPGVVAAVVEPNRLVAVGAAGVRERGKPAPIGRDDRMHLGSCTKAVTATLVALLVADGALRFDSTVGEIFGPTTPEMDASWKDVTISDLLRNRGGAPGQPNAADWGTAFTCNAEPRACREAFVRSMLSRPVAQPRGEFVYSNQGYALAGVMCEAATGTSWEALVRDRLLVPLGATTFGFGPPSAATGGAAPVGHAEDGAVRDIDNPSAISPAGRLHLSLPDWARFVALHLRRDARPSLPLTPETFARLHAPSDDANAYAYGWRGATRPWGGNVIMHAGSNSLWFCVAWLAPERGFAVLVACNQGPPEGQKLCDEIAASLIEWETARLAGASPKPASRQ